MSDYMMTSGLWNTMTGSLLWLVVTAAATLMLSANADTVLITGANSGIGLEFTKQYASRDWTVIATHRRSRIPESPAAVTIRYRNVSVEHMDVTSPDDINVLAKKLKDTPIDVLINNAGVYNDRSTCRVEDCPGDWSNQSFGKLNYSLFDTIMSVNVKGPLMVSEAFLNNVRAGKQKKLSLSVPPTARLPNNYPDRGQFFTGPARRL